MVSCCTSLPLKLTHDLPQRSSRLIVAATLALAMLIVGMALGLVLPQRPPHVCCDWNRQSVTTLRMSSREVLTLLQLRGLGVGWLGESSLCVGRLARGRESRVVVHD